MQVGDKAGRLPVNAELVNIQRLIARYYEEIPDSSDPLQAVVFGTSGHRGSPLLRSYTRSHIAAIAQAIAELRRSWGATGPLFIGIDTHALSEPALHTAIEVLCANNVEIVAAADFAYTPTPVISREIVRHNFGRTEALADGIIITPSHNPPTDGGFKYNPPLGGPANPFFTEPIAKRANEILKDIQGGVYELRLGDHEGRGGTKTGLPIDIFDRRNEQLRPPSSLSGGETFFVSLALALALADIIQAENGGLSMETLFIDEGFGTLSDDYLDDVMGILRDIAKTRDVGIISHVGQLKDQIHERISVTRVHPDAESRLAVIV